MICILLLYGNLGSQQNDILMQLWNATRCFFSVNLVAVLTVDSIVGNDKANQQEAWNWNKSEGGGEEG